MLLINPIYAGEAWNMLMRSPSFILLWPPPKMPVPPENILSDGLTELQDLGVCLGNNVSYFNAEANTYHGKKIVTFIYWRGQLHITIDSDEGATLANHIWVDYDCDGIAEEHHYGDYGLRNEYGSRAWFCHPLKRVLNHMEMK